MGEGPGSFGRLPTAYLAAAFFFGTALAGAASASGSAAFFAAAFFAGLAGASSAAASAFTAFFAGAFFFGAWS